MPHADHEAFTPPDSPDAILWRYSSFGKMMSIIATGKMFFTKSSEFDDPYEGTVPRKSAEKMTNRDARALAKRPFAQEPPRDRLVRGARELNRAMPVNCWCELPYESAAMWQLYAPADEGVAIRTSFGRLAKAFEETDESVYIGRINYIDFETEEIPTHNTLYALMCKRREFEHEHEVRAVVSPYYASESRDLTTPPFHGSSEIHRAEHERSGLSISINLDSLIESIWVAPTAPSWIRDSVESTVRKFGVTASVYQSELFRDPEIT